MPSKGTPTCLKCETNESPIWTNAENLGALCLKCVTEAKDENRSDDETTSTTGGNGTSTGGGYGNNDDASSAGGSDQKISKKKVRTRSYKTRLNPLALPKVGAPKGRGRRAMFKKMPLKAPAAVATPVSSEHVFYKGMYYQTGDIVSLVDVDDGIYYAQLRGFLTDQYCEKSAVITWLLPTRDSPPPETSFDPATYILGPEEELPRKLECMEFVMHAPSDYYKARGTPYPHVHPSYRPGYIWTTLETVRRLRDTAAVRTQPVINNFKDNCATVTSMTTTDTVPNCN